MPASWPANIVQKYYFPRLGRVQRTLAKLENHLCLCLRAVRKVRAGQHQSRRLQALNRPRGSDLSRLDIFDCQSIFEVVDVLRHFKSIAGADQPGPSPNFDYRACFEILKQSRERLGFAPSHNSLALATVDPDSEGQGRFITAISRLGILVEPIDFRDASVTLPLIGDADRSERRYVKTLAPHITYVLGLLAARPSPEVIVVTRAFELFGPLRDFVEKRGGKAAIAFFRRYLDARFGLAGLFEADSTVKFVDLEPESEKIVGCDMRQIGSGPRSRSQGISGL